MIDSGDEVIIGVNKYTLAEQESCEVRSIDNRSVREAQIASINQVKATRDAAKVKAALEAITNAAQTGTGKHVFDMSSQQAFRKSFGVVRHCFQS